MRRLAWVACSSIIPMSGWAAAGFLALRIIVSPHDHQHHHFNHHRADAVYCNCELPIKWWTLKRQSLITDAPPMWSQHLPVFAPDPPDAVGVCNTSILVGFKWVSVSVSVSMANHLLVNQSARWFGWPPDAASHYNLHSRAHNRAPNQTFNNYNKCARDINKKNWHQCKNVVHNLIKYI